MDLKVDSRYIKHERQQRGWSQEQLAAAAGLGVRTIQRLETSGIASGESAKCIAAVFEVPLARVVVRTRWWLPNSAWQWLAGAATVAGAVLAGSLLWVSLAKADDLAMALVVGTEVTGESRMNIHVKSGQQTEVRLEKDLRLLFTPTARGSGAVMVSLEVYGWDGKEFKLAGKPQILMRKGAETRLQLDLGNGHKARISVTPRED